MRHVDLRPPDRNLRGPPNEEVKVMTMKLVTPLSITYKATGIVEPGDRVTFTKKNTLHKTRQGEDAHYICAVFLSKGDTLTVTFSTD
jgi:hypothetical protein